MNRIQNIILWVALGAGFLSLLLVMRAQAPINVSNIPDADVNKVADAISQRLGAISGPDIPSPWIKVGGNKPWFYNTPMLASGVASTTVCSFRSPDATSTLMYVSANVSSTTPTTSIDIGYSQGLASTTNSTVTPAVPTATSTMIAGNKSFTGPLFLFAGGATTTLKNITDGIIYPRSYINVNVGANASTTGLIAGSCKIGFLEL